MNKISRKKFAFIFIAFSLLFLSSVSMLCSAQPIETTSLEGLSVLSSTLGLDLSKYNISTKNFKPEVSESYLDNTIVREISYEMESSQSKIKALYTFVNDHLQVMHILEQEGDPMFVKSQSLNVLQQAKDFLQNYQNNNANSIFGLLRNSIDELDISKNFTKKDENLQLEISSVKDSTTFKWTCISSGIIAPAKFVTLSFKNNFFSSFVDNWQFFEIIDKDLVLTKNEAITIALKAAKLHSWSLKLSNNALDVKNFNDTNVRLATLIYDSSFGAIKTREGGSMNLYPVWRVYLELDKWYGQLYGIEIDIWADNGEIRRVQEAWSSLPAPEGVPTAPMNSTEASTISPTLSFPFAIILISLFLFVFYNRKHLPSHSTKISSKTFGILLCVSLLLLTFIGNVETANAQAGAFIWGAESSGAIDPETGQSWRKHQDEIFFQGGVSQSITNYFNQAGFAATNHQGVYGSWASQIRDDITALRDSYEYGVVVDFDHGLGRTDYYLAPGEFHYMFEDQYGTMTGLPPPNFQNHPENAVYDLDIYSRTNPETIKFAFINTCMSARVSEWVGNYHLVPAQGDVAYGARGLPYAFTHRLVKDYWDEDFDVQNHISSRGYDYSDGSGQCYIGFPYGAASLMQRVPYDYGVHIWDEWVEYFFYYALMHDMSVHAALDQTCLIMYGLNFGDYQCPISPIGLGFIAYWWGLDTQPNCVMAVYGDAGIHLRILPEPTHWWLYVEAVETTFGTGLNPTVTVDNEPVGTAPLWELVSVGPHTVSVDDWAWSPTWGRDCYFSYFYTYPGGSYQGNPEQITVTQDTYTTAYYTMDW